MATVTKSIGTSSRDYSTITAWEADLDDTNIYTSGDDAVGECYNDSAFDESVTINGGSTVGLNSVTLGVASGEKHDGTAGTGVRIIASASYTSQISCSRSSLTVEWLECDGDQITAPSSYKRAIYSNADTIIKNVILHDIYSGRESFGFMTQGTSGGAKGTLLNSVIYNILSSGGTQQAIGIYIESGTGQTVTCYNNTVFNVSKSVNASAATGIASHSVTNLKNNIVVGTNGATTNKDFNNSGSNISYNLSSDSTASGTGSLTGKTAANQFVSTVSGSEDLHLKTGADAIAAGVDLGSSPVGVQYDIDGFDRDAGDRVWDIGADQAVATVVKTIGTSSRDYSTIIAWEAALDDPIYQTGDDAVGECYDDSTFNTAGININGGLTVGLSSVKLSVAESERHDGTLFTGVHINPTYSLSYIITTSRSNTIIEWLTLKTNGTSTYAHGAMIIHDIYSSNTISRYMVLKGEDQVYPSQTPIGIRTGGHENIAHNNIIYGIANGSVGGGIYDSYRRCNAYNNTIYGCNYGYYATQQGNDTRNVKNNLNIGNNYDFYANGTGGYVSSNNASSDSTATVLGGSNHITGARTSKQFVSTLSGSEDLHLKFTSAAIDAGVDLGTTPDGVQYDINGKDRDAENSIWDIGAHEFGDNVVYGLFTVL